MNALRGSRGSGPFFPSWYCVCRLVGQLIVPSSLGLSGTGQVSFSHRCRRAVCVCDIILRVCFVVDCRNGSVRCVRFTVEPRHDEDHGTMEVALSVSSLYQSERKQKKQKQGNYRELGPAELSCCDGILLCPTSL